MHRDKDIVPPLRIARKFVSKSTAKAQRSTIVQEPIDEVTYYHVELATHDVILAKGLPCESNLDTVNRAAFEGGEAPSRLDRGATARAG